MKNFGVLLLIIGGIWALIAFNMNATVNVGGHTVYNIGLMDERRNHLIMSALLIVVGTILYVFGNSGQTANVQSMQTGHIGLFGAIWGITGILLLLGSAIYRLTPIAIDAFSYAFAWHHWLSLMLILFFMAYAEGYRGFQKGFSPRVAARALYLKNHPCLLHSLLGPFFCMGFFHASRRRKITSFSVTSGIIVLIILVRFLVQPWRGIIDAGVVVGLAWGLVSLIIFSLRAFTSKDFPYSPEVP